MNRIRKLRKEKQITQVRLSIELEVSQENISAYETGKYFPSVKSLIKLRELFDASIDYILGLSDIRYSSTAFNDLTDDEQILIRTYRKLGKNGKERAIAYMEGYIDSMSEK